MSTGFEVKAALCVCGGGAGSFLGTACGCPVFKGHIPRTAAGHCCDLMVSDSAIFETWSIFSFSGTVPLIRDFQRLQNDSSITSQGPPVPRAVIHTAWRPELIGSHSGLPRCLFIHLQLLFPLNHLCSILLVLEILFPDGKGRNKTPAGHSHHLFSQLL